MLRRTGQGKFKREFKFFCRIKCKVWRIKFPPISCWSNVWASYILSFAIGNKVFSGEKIFTGYKVFRSCQICVVSVHHDLVELFLKLFRANLFDFLSKRRWYLLPWQCHIFVKTRISLTLVKKIVVQIENY